MKKVTNTLSSIGADAGSSQQMVLELARHFLRQNAMRVSENILKRPDFTPDKETSIRYSELTAEIDDQTREYFTKRILKFHPVSLHIFPSLRIDIRLTGIAVSSGLSAPLTELVLAPSLMNLTDAIDKTCLAVDAICERKGFASDVPIKLILNLADASLFTRDWMECSTASAQEQCAVSLGEMLCGMLTRQPIKMTCS